mmetsp:Transcript_92730/g.200448  ORF Transcript_92730/g.200448 Transcript_92730/m.200448 type:complete len:245 (-) Transcript_92730:223-957(-)
MESDFPSLGPGGTADSNGAQISSSAGVSWAAAIMKAPSEIGPESVKKTDEAAVLSPSDADKEEKVLKNSEAPVGNHNGTDNGTDGADIGVVSFGNATAWMTGQTESPTSSSLGLAGDGSSTSAAPAPATEFVAAPTISFGAFDESGVAANVPEEQKKEEDRPPQQQQQSDSSSSSGRSGEKSKRPAKGNASRPQAAVLTADEGKAVDGITEEVAEQSCSAEQEGSGNGWGGPKRSFLDIVRGGK